MKVDAAHVDRFTDILHYTALANLVLVPALVWEGTVKGFERYNLLRMSEFASTLAYVALTVWASTVSASFEIVAYIYLATLVIRALAVLVATITALTKKSARFAAWTSPIRRELLHRCLLLLQGKLIGGITGPIQPFVAGLLFGPTAVGTYDALVRLARVSKILVGLLTSALLPVASRLDERGSSTTFQRLGELGLIMLPMFTLPPLAAAAVPVARDPADVDRPSARTLRSLDGPELCDSHLHAVPRDRQRHLPDAPGIQARLNWLMSLQLLIWAAVAAATLGFLPSGH